MKYSDKEEKVMVQKMEQLLLETPSDLVSAYSESKKRASSHSIPLRFLYDHKVYKSLKGIINEIKPVHLQGNQQS